MKLHCIFIILLFTLISLCYSCICKKQSSGKIKDNFYWTLYQSAKESGDLYLCINSLHFLANSSKDSIQIFDSLSMIYFQLQSYHQSIYWSKKSLGHRDSNWYALEILSKSYQKNAQLIKAIAAYEKLLQLQPKPEYYLFLAECQYRSKRLLECIQTTEIANSIPNDQSFQYIYIDTIGMKRSTNVKSALLNCRGLAYFELNQRFEAEQSFNEALMNDPEFLLPKLNLLTIRNKTTETH